MLSPCRGSQESSWEDRRASFGYPAYICLEPLSTKRIFSRASKGKGRKHLGHERDEDLLPVNAELDVKALSSILRDSDLKKADSMSFGEALASSL